MESSSNLSKCKSLCGKFPCMYADDKGCSTSDPTGEFCKKKIQMANKFAKVHI